jgi:hypothetical protein
MLLEQADNVVIVVGAATGVYKYFALDAAKYISLSTPSSQIMGLPKLDSYLYRFLNVCHC